MVPARQARVCPVGPIPFGVGMLDQVCLDHRVAQMSRFQVRRLDPGHPVTAHLDPLRHGPSDTGQGRTCILEVREPW
jgi:hypothetical protein